MISRDKHPTAYFWFWWGVGQVVGNGIAMFIWPEQADYCLFASIVWSFIIGPLNIIYGEK